MKRTVSNFIGTVLRVLWVVFLQIYCICTYVVVFSVIWPLKFLIPSLHETIQKYLSLWGYTTIATVVHTAGYPVVEAGDDITDVLDDSSLVLVNHQSPADILMIIYVMSHRFKMAANLMWVISSEFIYTHFGIATWLRGDFFIQQGRKERQGTLESLEQHIKQVYIPLNRKWILVFPEGGFLHKRLKGSHKFAKANGLPILNHVTLPRAGASYSLMKALSSPLEKQRVSENGPCMSNQRLKWVIDVTIGYPDGRPISVLNMLLADRPPTNVVFHYRKYPIQDVPTDQERLTRWLYDRYIEKEKLLDVFYKSGRFPAHSSGSEQVPYRQLEWSTPFVAFTNLIYILAFFEIIYLCKTMFF